LAGKKLPRHLKLYVPRDLVGPQSESETSAVPSPADRAGDF
jgi:hypothetical protein